MGGRAACLCCGLLLLAGFACRPESAIDLDAEPDDLIVLVTEDPGNGRTDARVLRGPDRLWSLAIGPEIAATAFVIPWRDLIGPDGLPLPPALGDAVEVRAGGAAFASAGRCGRCMSPPSDDPPAIVRPGEACPPPAFARARRWQIASDAIEGDGGAGLAAVRGSLRIGWPGECSCDLRAAPRSEQLAVRECVLGPAPDAWRVERASAGDRGSIAAMSSRWFAIAPAGGGTPGPSADRLRSGPLDRPLVGPILAIAPLVPDGFLVSSRVPEGDPAEESRLDFIGPPLEQLELARRGGLLQVHAIAALPDGDVLLGGRSSRRPAIRRCRVALASAEIDCDLREDSLLGCEGAAGAIREIDVDPSGHAIALGAVTDLYLRDSGSNEWACARLHAGDGGAGVLTRIVHATLAGDRLLACGVEAGRTVILTASVSAVRAAIDAPRGVLRTIAELPEAGGRCLGWSKAPGGGAIALIQNQRAVEVDRSGSVVAISEGVGTSGAFAEIGRPVDDLVATSSAATAARVAITSDGALYGAGAGAPFVRLLGAPAISHATYLGAGAISERRAIVLAGDDRGALEIDLGDGDSCGSISPPAAIGRIEGFVLDENDHPIGVVRERGSGRWLVHGMRYYEDATRSWVAWIDPSIAPPRQLGPRIELPGEPLRDVIELVPGELLLTTGDRLLHLRDSELTELLVEPPDPLLGQLLRPYVRGGSSFGVAWVVGDDRITRVVTAGAGRPPRIEREWLRELRPGSSFAGVQRQFSAPRLTNAKAICPDDVLFTEDMDRVIQTEREEGILSWQIRPRLEAAPRCELAGVARGSELCPAEGFPLLLRAGAETQVIAFGAFGGAPALVTLAGEVIAEGGERAARPVAYAEGWAVMRDAILLTGTHRRLVALLAADQ